MRLASSSAYYQRFMNQVVTDIFRVFSNLDDVIVMTPDLHEHKPILHVLMQRLRVLNSEKCALAVRSLMFLGHRVTGESVSSTETKVQFIHDIALPKTKRQLCRYLGMYHFYAKFVKYYCKCL